MASKPREAPQENSRPAAKGPAPVVIRHAGIPGLEDDTGKWHRLIPAIVISGVVHVVLAVLFLIFNVGASAGTVETEIAVVETKIDDNKPPPNLDNEEIGLDPDVPTNYNINRIEEVSVPGPVNPTEAVGIKDAPEATPQTIPPPPGFGGSQGQGGGNDSDKDGHASMVGTPGGMGGKLVPGGFGGRSGATREKMAIEGGGNTRSEACVARGLKWFSLHQSQDGHWSLDNFQQAGRCNCTGAGQGNDIAGTAFGLLPFLGAGNTHKPDSSKNSPNQYYKNVERGLRFLLTKQSKETGDFGGGMYAHGLATIAVCEAYGLTSDPQLKTAAQKGINFIASAQGPGGGWGYSPRAGNNDTSVGGWQVMALKSGQMSGLDVPSKTLAGATKFLDANSSADGGGYGYNGPGDGASAMTAVGLLCRQYLGWGPRQPGLQAGIAKLQTLPPDQAPTMYYNYYATQVMHHMGGKPWQEWNPKMRDLLCNRQDQVNSDKARPHQYGSWSPAGDAHGGAGGRVMISSMSLLTLEVYYRHLPLYRREGGGGK